MFLQQLHLTSPLLTEHMATGICASRTPQRGTAVLCLQRVFGYSVTSGVMKCFMFKEEVILQTSKQILIAV